MCDDTICTNIGADHCYNVTESEDTKVEDIKPVCEEMTTVRTEVIENVNIEDIMPVYEEITTMKTEVIEECYNYETLDGVESEDVKRFSMSECSRAVTDERAGISAYKQTQKDCYGRYIVWCKEENGFGLSEDVAVKVVKKYACDKCSYITKNRPNFRRHTLVHNKRFNCETCRRSFQRKDALQKHTEIHKRKQYVWHVYCTHINKRSPNTYKCEHCDHATNCKEKIKKTRGDKKHTCQYCDFSTHSNRKLTRHLLCKHANTNSIPSKIGGFNNETT